MRGGRRSNNRRARSLGFILILALLLSACARPNPPPAPPTWPLYPLPEISPTSPPPPAATKAAAPTPPPEIIPAGIELPVLDPLPAIAWASISPPFSIYALAVDPFNPNTLYIGVDGGVLKTIDRGASWSAASQGLSDPNAFAAVLSNTASQTANMWDMIDTLASQLIS